ncbi:MAG: hypothetical protein E7064_01150 [Spirochaetaceae bacterium]|nr:hypothetical protein [Spirochaetaceae bacterium]
MKKSLLIVVVIIFQFSLFSCGFTINDMIQDYNSNFDHTPIMKFISNGNINPDAIIQEEYIEVQKDSSKGGQNHIFAIPTECESATWKISPNCEGHYVIQDNGKRLVIYVDTIPANEYTIYVTAFYQSQGYDDSCRIKIYE